jgi:hypothetical protein
MKTYMAYGRLKTTKLSLLKAENMNIEKGVNMNSVLDVTAYKNNSHEEDESQTKCEKLRLVNISEGYKLYT